MIPKPRLPAVCREVSHPAAGRDGENHPPGSCPDGELQPLVAVGSCHRAAGNSHGVAACWQHCWQRAGPGPAASPRFGGPALHACPLAAQGSRGDTPQRGDAVGMSRSIPASRQLGHRAGQPCPPPAWHVCSLCPEFPEGCGNTTEQLGLLMEELWQCGPHMSAARTCVPWGDVGGVGGRAEFVHWQQLEPLPPADSVSALLGV